MRFIANREEKQEGSYLYTLAVESKDLLIATEPAEDDIPETKLIHIEMSPEEVIQVWEPTVKSAYNFLEMETEEDKKKRHERFSKNNLKVMA